MAEKMKKMPESISKERRWTPGSYAAAGFALFILLYNLGSMLFTINMPTDGWLLGGEILSEPPEVVFRERFLAEPSVIMEGDRLLKVNDQSMEQILQAQHEFLTMTSPDWPDGTVLQYEVQRSEERLILDVPIRKASLWEYYEILLNPAARSSLMMAVTGFFFFIIGIFVFLLRPSNRAAHALLFLGIGFFPLASNNTIPASFYPIPPISIPFDNWTLVVNASLMYLVLSFPYPKAPLRRYPTLSILLIYLTWPVAFNVAYFLFQDNWRAYREAAFTIYPLQILLVMLITLVSLVHSALTVRDPIGRNQLKWMMAGVLSFVFVGVGGWLVSAYLFPGTMESGNWLITTIGWFLMPVCLAIAITRYRLFDIDVIIRRTLVYGALSTTLALIYLGSVVVLQGLLAVLTGESRSEVVTVVTTLVIAALFTPLRRRIQQDIDRRFYRRRFDANKTLTAFASTLRDEVDINDLGERLVSVVEDTLQPEYASLWMRSLGKET